LGRLVEGSSEGAVWVGNAKRRGGREGDGRKKWRVRGHHAARPPLVPSGLEVVPDDEYTFRDSRPRACASRDRMYETTRAFVSQEAQGRKA
jgi:hypothetical protein